MLPYIERAKDCGSPRIVWLPRATFKCGCSVALFMAPNLDLYFGPAVVLGWAYAGHNTQNRPIYLPTSIPCMLHA